MPAAAFFFHHAYGPAAAALVAPPGVGDAVTLAPVLSVRAGVVGVGTGDAPLLRPYRMRNAAVQAQGSGDAPLLRPVKRVRAGLRVTVSALSQDDVAGAVLESPIEGALTLKQALRILLAQAAGDATGLDGSPAFKSLDGSKTRVAGTLSGGTRTITTLDGT
jgi:hypothetical protein